MVGSSDKKGSSGSNPPELSIDTEGDVELKVIPPLLTGSNFLEIPIASIKDKSYLPPTQLDKKAGKASGYFPDFSVWEMALPVMIVEAKAPDVTPEVGYREAALYAHHLNKQYKTGLNPCRFILACNGIRLLAGFWDADPEIDVLVRDLVIGSEATQRLREYCAKPSLAAYAAECRTKIRPAQPVKPYNLAGGAALLASKKAFNTFAAELTPLLRRYFTSTSQNSDKDIYERGYVGSDDVTTYDRILESLLKDRISSRRGSLNQDLHPSRSSEPKLTTAIKEFKSGAVGAGQLQLITGGVGSGKSLFARRYKELLQPEDQRRWTHWAYIDFNSAPASLQNAEDWVCRQFVESFQVENPDFDPYSAESLPRIFSRELQKQRGIYDELKKISDVDAQRQRVSDLQAWQNDPQKIAFGICEHFAGQRQEVIVVVMDNVDRLDLQNQLDAFQLSLWFLGRSQAFVILQMRDETFERFKDQPPLDTFRSGIVFHINPPRFLDVVKRRLELCLDYLSQNADEKLDYALSSGARIVYPRTMLGEFLKGIYLELFERKHNVSRILQGIAGRDVRRALDMFVSILNSGHLREEAITSHAVGAREIAIPEHTILKILMRTEYRFFSEASGFVSNVFHIGEEWAQANNFLVSDILFWLSENRKKRRTIGLEGYFAIDHLADVMQLRGYLREDVSRACSWLLQHQLVDADHMNRSLVKSGDSVKVSASGFIHLRILCERIEYLYSVLSVTPILDQRVAARISDYISRENQHDRLNAAQKVQCVEEFLKYLKYQHSQLRSAYPQFGGEQTGADFVIAQMEGTISHFRNPEARLPRQPNFLDD